MENIRKVHCFFEQSGTFKNEFIKLGIPAEDYDIQNNFGETDHVVDLFKAIEDAYDGKSSLFDSIVGGGRRRPDSGILSMHLLLRKQSIVFHRQPPQSPFAGCNAESRGVVAEVKVKRVFVGTMSQDVCLV